MAAAAAQRALEVLAEEAPAVAAEVVALQDGASDGQDKEGEADERSAAPGLHTALRVVRCNQPQHSRSRLHEYLQPLLVL